MTSPRDTDEPMQDEVLADMTLRRRDRFGSRQAARANFESKAPFDTFTPQSLDAYVAHCFEPVGTGDEITLACPKAQESELYRQGRFHGLYERLSGASCPVVVGAGPPVPGSPSSFAAGVSERLARCRLIRYDDLGHFGPQQAPARIAADIRHAWSRPTAGAASPAGRKPLGSP